MNIRSLAVRVLITFLVLIGYLQEDMMFWTVAWQNEGWVYSNWVNIWWGETPLLQITVYNSWCIFGLCILGGLGLMWINYLVNEYRYWRNAEVGNV